MSGFNAMVFLHGEQIDCSIIPLWEDGKISECQVFRNDEEREITNDIDEEEYGYLLNQCEENG